MFDDKTVLNLLQQNPVYKSALELASSKEERQQIEQYTIDLVKSALGVVIAKTNELKQD